MSGGKTEKAMNDKEVYLLKNICKILLDILILLFLIFCYLVYRPAILIKDGGLYIYFGKWNRIIGFCVYFLCIILFFILTRDLIKIFLKDRTLKKKMKHR